MASCSWSSLCNFYDAFGSLRCMSMIMSAYCSNKSFDMKSKAFESTALVICAPIPLKKVSLPRNIGLKEIVRTNLIPAQETLIFKNTGQHGDSLVVIRGARSPAVAHSGFRLSRWRWWAVGKRDRLQNSDRQSICYVLTNLPDMSVTLKQFLRVRTNSNKPARCLAFFDDSDTVLGSVLTFYIAATHVAHAPPAAQSSRLGCVDL
ncbi:hypothetical protein DFH11DRAFT_1741038 [Phellopilus nigrolimitatus]|nr:hypothetical protein DFH11DRAFT_1741038 [Phellopilus nigrolimitatus]